jgi:hypothetical protein
LSSKKEIGVLTVERVRANHHDFQRALKMGESRLRKLHEDYQVAGSTPPTVLERDLQDLRAAAQKTRLARFQGREVPSDPAAAALVERYWEEYRLAYEALLEDLAGKRQSGLPGSQVYWEATKAFAGLRESALQSLVHNAPPGEKDLDRALARDEGRLLRSLEGPEVKSRSRAGCVVTAEEHARPATFAISPFYQSQGLLPADSPQAVGAFTVPPGCRTVTRYESGRRLVLRASRGKGRAHIGAASKEIGYGYFAVPPDAPYFLENTGDEPLDLDYVALNP